MTTEPLVSVIIPTYNQARFLGECLDSLLAQTYARWEAIIINNYSTDDTLAVIARYADERIRLINFKNNGIIAAARNQGLRTARGEYIAFLDSDDLWLPEKLERQCRALVEHPEVMLCSTNGYWFSDRTKQRRIVYRIPFNKRVSFRAELWSNRFVNSTVVLRRGVLDTVGYLDEDPRVAGSEDYDYWVRILHRYERSALILGAPLALIREHVSNVSNVFHTGANTLLDKVTYIYEKYSDYDPRFIARARERIRANMVYLALSRGAIPLKRMLFMSELLLRYRIDLFVKALGRWAVYGRERTSQIESAHPHQASPLSRRVSIALVIPTKDRKSELRRFLASVAEQMVQPQTIIIVDASTVKDESLRSEFPKLMIDYVHVDHPSSTQQRNVGIARLPQGIEYVAIFDDDITLCPGAMEHMAGYWQSAPLEVGGAAFNIINDKPPTLLAHVKNVFLTGCHRRGVALRSGFNSSVTPARETMEVSWLFGGATVWRRAVLEAVKFDEWFDAYGLGEDFDFSITVARSHRLMVIADAQVQHLHGVSSRVDRFTFGKKELLNRAYIVRKHPDRFSRGLFLWGCVGMLLENGAVGIVTLNPSRLRVAAGNLAALHSMLTGRETAC